MAQICWLVCSHNLRVGEEPVYIQMRALSSVSSMMLSSLGVPIGLVIYVLMSTAAVSFSDEQTHRFTDLQQ